MADVFGFGEIVSTAANMTADVIAALIREGRLEEARQYIENMPIPDVDKLSYKAVLLKDPAQLPALMQKDTRLANISEDPAFKQAQMNALGQLQQRGAEGYTDVERAQMQRTMNEALTSQKGANQAMDSQMARRGIGGSGIDIAGRLARQQAGITGASQAGLDIASQGQQRALQAMQGAGSLASGIRGQEWGQKSQAASAQDIINASNIRNQMSAGQFNISNQMNTGMANQAAEMQAAKSRADAEKAKVDAERENQAALAKTYMG